MCDSVIVKIYGHSAILCDFELSGLYCSGWAKLGPVGVIVTTMTDAFETGASVVHDLKSGVLQSKQEHTGKEAVQKILASRGVFWFQNSLSPI